MEIGDAQDPYGAVGTQQLYGQRAEQPALLVGADQPLVQDK
jgi:hypothetical protein